MPSLPPHQSNSKVVPLHSQAEANLAYIRSTMQASTLFTGVSGKGMVLVGLSALLACRAAESPASTPDGWVLIWLTEALVAAALSLFFMARKVRCQEQMLWSASGQKLLFAMAPALVAGAILSLFLGFTPQTWLLPTVWLLLYGAGVTTAGAHSIPIVPIMGGAFMMAGALNGLNEALGLPLPAWLGMAAGFGGLHILFGTIIWRQHGG